jgi:hypothetical protein
MIGTQPKDGTCHAFSFLTASILTPGRRLVLCIVPLTSREGLPTLVLALLERIQKRVDGIAYIVFDNGFQSNELIKEKVKTRSAREISASAGSLNRKRILGSRLFHLSSAVAWGAVDAYIGSNSYLHYDCMRPDLWIGPIGWIVFSVIPMIWMNMIFTHIFCTFSNRPLRSVDKFSLTVVTKRGLVDRVCECSIWFLAAEYLSYAIQAKRLSYFYDYWKSALGIPFVSEPVEKAFVSVKELRSFLSSHSL